MPTYYARKSGNVNATDVWATTPTGTAAAVTFAAGDVLVANSFTVTVNVNTNLGATGEVRNDTTGGATAGGAFSLSNGVTLTASVFAGSAACVTLASTVSATITGNVTGGSATNAYGVSAQSTGRLTITGAIAGGSGATAHGVYANSANPLITITGNVIAGNGNFACGFFASGSVTGASVTIVGNVTAVSSANGVYWAALGTLTVTGTCTGTSSSGLFTGAGTVTVIGTAVGGAGQAGVQVNSSNTVFVTRAKGGPLAASSVGVSAASTSIVSVEEIEFGDLGASPTSGPIRLTDLASNVAVMYRFGTTKKTLTDPNASGLMPAASNVRSGVVYNGGNSTGTCAVPAAGSVALGVPVDNTTGTAALTPAAVWDYATSAATTSGSMGERLKDAATVASTGQQLANALTP